MDFLFVPCLFLDVSAVSHLIHKILSFFLFRICSLFFCYFVVDLVHFCRRSFFTVIFGRSILIEVYHKVELNLNQKDLEYSDNEQMTLKNATIKMGHNQCRYYLH